VHAVSLTGLADRSHLGGPGADLDTHVTDVVQALRFAEATDIVLVGHGYAGTVVAAAADRAPELAGTVVYVDMAALPGASRRSTPRRRKPGQRCVRRSTTAGNCHFLLATHCQARPATWTTTPGNACSGSPRRTLSPRTRSR
jgi:pimeloyl-ACP methyl ester carboxylesterase